MTAPAILDIDLDSDVDDALDLLMVSRLHDAGEIDLRLVAVTSAHDYAGGCAASLLDAFGNGDIPIAQWKGGGGDSSTFAQTVVTNYPVAGKQTKSDFADSTNKYRETLAAAADASVTIVTGGAMTSLSALLDSSADGFSALTGAQLVAAKVTRLIVNGGAFPDSETGISDLAKDPTAADNVASNWPTPVVWIGVDQGFDVRTGQWLLNESDGPLKLAYMTHMPDNPLTFQSQQNGKRSFVQASLLYAVQGIGDIYTIGGQDGTVTVDSSTGRSTWAASPDSGHSYLERSQSPRELERILNEIMRGNISVANYLAGSYSLYDNDEWRHRFILFVPSAKKASANTVAASWDPDDGGSNTFTIGVGGFYVAETQVTDAMESAIYGAVDSLSLRLYDERYGWDFVAAKDEQGL